jgi:hypothetical protein
LLFSSSLYNTTLLLILVNEAKEEPNMSKRKSQTIDPMMTPSDIIFQFLFTKKMVGTCYIGSAIDSHGKIRRLCTSDTPKVSIDTMMVTATAMKVTISRLPVLDRPQQIRHFQK